MRRLLLITGGSGLLGVHAVERALAGREFRKVVLAARVPRRAPLRPRWLESLDSGRLQFLELDLAEPGAAERALARLRPSAVLSLAACSRQSEAEAYPDLALRLNARAPREIAAWCAAAESRLVHVSTDLVFEGGTVAVPGPGSAQVLEELDEPRPLNVYARTKRDGELAVLEALERALVVRLPLLFGDSRGRSAGAADALVAGLMERRRTVLFTDEERQPLELTAAAERLVGLCVRPEVCGTLHLPGPELLTRAEFGLRLLSARTAVGRSVLPAPELAGRASLGLADERPARLELSGLRARVVFHSDPEPLQVGIDRWTARG